MEKVHLLIVTMQTVWANQFICILFWIDAPILEMLEVRKIMESEAARLASVQATPEDIEKIRIFKEKREKQILEMDKNKDLEDYFSQPL